MSKYIIKACNSRLYYVEHYLIPSMKAQGIADSDVLLHIDKDNIGCLETCMRVFANAKEDMWYMQDDIIICSDFKERTEKYDKGLVNGFCYEKQEQKQFVGKVKPKNYWFSFPCIRIPKKIANECAKWFYLDVIQNREYRMWIRVKKYDDALFNIFMQDYYPDYIGLNLAPTLVDHIDYLIGGSVVNSQREEKETHTAYFKDQYLIDELKKKLLLDKHYNT